MLSARAKGAAGGGLELEVSGGLNGLGWTKEITRVSTGRKSVNLKINFTNMKSTANRRDLHFISQ